ncbi:MAG: hypothetical protein IJM38_03730 [Ruminococcus sp.]|nr:hypothetical protein [Ruminococcus sp.]
MANNSIRYSEGTDSVINTATQISELGDEFFREYTQLYNLVEGDMASNWKGEDFDAFKQRVNDEKHFFETMRDIITEYATFLRNTANAHEARMEDSKTQVDSNCSFD